MPIVNCFTNSQTCLSSAFWSSNRTVINEPTQTLALIVFRIDIFISEICNTFHRKHPTNVLNYLQSQLLNRKFLLPSSYINLIVILFWILFEFDCFVWKFFYRKSSFISSSLKVCFKLLFFYHPTHTDPIAFDPLLVPQMLLV